LKFILLFSKNSAKLLPRLPTNMFVDQTINFIVFQCTFTFLIVTLPIQIYLLEFLPTFCWMRRRSTPIMSFPLSLNSNNSADFMRRMCAWLMHVDFWLPNHIFVGTAHVPPLFFSCISGLFCVCSYFLEDLRGFFHKWSEISEIFSIVRFSSCPHYFPAIFELH
jgi:hypothetical protein